MTTCSECGATASALAPLFWNHCARCWHASNGPLEASLAGEHFGLVSLFVALWEELTDLPQVELVAKLGGVELAPEA